MEEGEGLVSRLTRPTFRAVAREGLGTRLSSSSSDARPRNPVNPLIQQFVKTAQATSLLQCTR